MAIVLRQLRWFLQKLPLALAPLLLFSAYGQGIPGIVAATSTPELVQEGFVFTEGTVGTANGGLFFTDTRNINKTYRMDPTGKATVVRSNNNRSNGLALTRAGELLSAEGDRVTLTKMDGSVITLTEGIPGQPLLAPNDLISDGRGGIYFTDPGPRPVVPGRITRVYYLPLNARIPVVVDQTITRPNGLTLTNDGKTLIVDDTIGDTVFAFDVRADGTTTEKRVFGRLHDIAPGEESGADGMAIDRADRVYITTNRGIQVLDKHGRYLGTIKVDRRIGNLAFSGPDKQTLYIAASEAIYRLKMLSRGPLRLGK